MLGNIVSFLNEAIEEKKKVELGADGLLSEIKSIRELVERPTAKLQT